MGWGLDGVGQRWGWGIVSIIIIKIKRNNVEIMMKSIAMGAIPEGAGHIISNRAERARKRTERLPLIWLWGKSLLLWSVYRIKSAVVVG